MVPGKKIVDGVEDPQRVQSFVPRVLATGSMTCRLAPPSGIAAT
jgi:hypothetical protein